MSKNPECRQIEPLFDRYLDGDITVAEYRQLRDHLNECLRCRDDWHGLERTVRQVESLERMHVSDQFMPALLSQLPIRRKMPRAWKRWTVEAAAAVVILTVVGFGSASSGYTAMVTMPGPTGPRTVTSTQVTMLPENSVLEGNLTVVHGDVYIAGRVNGNVTAVEGSARPVAEVEAKPRSFGEKVVGHCKTLLQSFLRGLDVLF